MKSIYRIRPCNENTIDEVVNHYLWFSRRKGFKDVYDANIGLFIDNNEILSKALRQRFTDDYIKKLEQKMDCTGICCFTEEKTSFHTRKHFPNSSGGICIEYDKDILEEYFLNSKYTLPNCFEEVQYFDIPIIFEKDDDFHILTQKTQDGIIYDSVKSLTYNERSMDRLLRILLTRINSKYRFQKEKRIILGGKNIPDFSEDLLGYKIEIPKESITAIYKYKDTPINFCDKLEAEGISLSY